VERRVDAFNILGASSCTADLLEMANVLGKRVSRGIDDLAPRLFSHLTAIENFPSDSANEIGSHGDVGRPK